MEKFQTWPSNFTNYNSVLSNSSSLTSSSSSSPSISHEEETHSTPTLCGGSSSFKSLESKILINNNNNNNNNNPKIIISHLCILSTKTKTPQINCLAVRNNALYAATAGEVNVFDLKTHQLIDTFGPGSGIVKSIAFGGNKIFTAHQDRKIRVWKQQRVAADDNQKHRLISTLPTFKDRAFNCMLPKNYVQIRRHEQRLWIEHADAVSGLAIDDEVGLMYSISWDKCFKIWNISSGPRCLESVQAHSDAVNAIVVSPLDRTVYTGSADGEIKIWAACEDTQRHELITTLNEHESSVNALALTDSGSGFCSGGGDGVILVWERDNNNNNNNSNVKSSYLVECCLEGHKGAILCLVHVRSVLISGSSDRTVRVWGFGEDNLRGCLVILEGHSKPVKALVAISDDHGDDDHDDQKLDCLSVYSGSLDGEIRAWKINISHANF